MKIVIEIDEETYNDIKRGKIYSSYRDVPQESVVAIANGTPLQKEHGDAVSRDAVLDLVADYDLSIGQVVKGIHALPSVTPQTKPNIKALGEDIRICQKSITDKKVLIGFNMAVALCNKHLSESEVQND